MRRLILTVVCLGVALSLFADAQLNKVSDFTTSFHRVAILPAKTPDGIDPLAVERSLYSALVGRRVPVVPAVSVRQALFDIGATTPSQDALKAVASKLKVDAFLQASVGEAGRSDAAPLGHNVGSVELVIVSVDTGKTLMHGIATGQSGWRSAKSVVEVLFQSIIDKFVTPEFIAAHSEEAMKAWISTSSPR